MTERSTARYETAVATFVGVVALLVSAYTAYVQRQQVRAQVLPILQYGTANNPITIGIENKGVGPALIKHVVVTVDGEPMPDWKQVLEKILGPGKHNYSENDIGSLILSPNETVFILTPRDATGEKLQVGPPGSPGALLNEGRLHIAVEICYCSTLGDCWMLKAAGRGIDTREEVRHCPAPSSRTFRE